VAERALPIVAISPRLLRRAQAATYLGISPAQLDLLRARGEIRPVPVPSDRSPNGQSRIPLYDRLDLDAAINRWKGGAAA